MKNILTKSDMGGVKQSLIANILFLFILEPLIHILKRIASRGIVALMDYFYYSCGRIDNAYFVSYVLFIAFFAYMITSLRDFIKLYRSAFVCKEKDLNEKDAATEEKRDLDVIVEAAIKIEQKKSKKKRQERMIKTISWLTILSQIAILFYISVYMYMPAVENRLFQQKIVQITPYAEREKIELLKSKWVSMETKDDYILIIDEIDQIQEENGLK